MPRITTEREAYEALLEWQEREGLIRTAPDASATIKTDVGWAHFNVNGYLGTVTENGDVVEEPELADD